MTDIAYDATVTALQDQFAEIVRLCADLDDTQWDADTCLPGWTIKDTVAHMAGTELMLLGEPTPDVPVDHLSHLRNDIARLNEAWIESMRPLSGIEVLDRFRAATAARMLAVRAMNQGDFDAESWTPAGKATYGRFMRIRAFYCHLHEQDIREALDMDLRTDAVAVGFALDEAATGLGYLAGKRAGLPDGTSLRIDLHEPDRTFLVDVTGRAAVVGQLDREPTLTVTMSSAEFLRRIGGRRPATEAPPHGVILGGDQALGQRFVDHLAFTI